MTGREPHLGGPRIEREAVVVDGHDVVRTDGDLTDPVAGARVALEGDSAATVDAGLHRTDTRGVDGDVEGVTPAGVERAVGLSRITAHDAHDARIRRRPAKQAVTAGAPVASSR